MTTEQTITTSELRVPTTGLQHSGQLWLVLAAMRPLQWIKNGFVVAPIIFAMKMLDPTSVGRISLALLSFCFVSSFTYLVNDLFDAKADRLHPQKRLRPIACGALLPSVAIVAAILCLLVSLSVAVMLGTKFAIVIGVYLALTVGYNCGLKHMLIIDAMTIAAGFVLRVVGGAVVIDVVPTHWLILCTFLLALFLAFAKRRQELLALSDGAAQHRHVLHQYSIPFLDRVITALIAATIVSYSIYTVAPETYERFGTNQLIYGVVFVIFGLLRYMALLEDCNQGQNPSKTLICDVPLLVSVAGWVVFNAIVLYAN